MKAKLPAVDLLVMDPVGTGHHCAYVVRILTAVAERGGRVAFLASRELLDAPEISAVRSSYGDSIRAVPVEPPAPPTRGFGIAVALRSSFVWWLRLRSWYRAASADLSVKQVFLPYLDHCSFAAGLLGPPCGDVPWQAIAMRTHFFHRDDAAGVGMVARIKRAALMRLARNRSLIALHLIDPVAVKEIARAAAPPRSVAFLADPAPCSPVPRSVARTALGLADDNFYILLYGAISLRKGLATLLTAISSHSIDRKVIAILAGIADAEASALLARHSELEKDGRLILFDRYIEPDFADQLFSAADCVWLVYQGHQGMSGVLVQAGRNSRAVIAADVGLIGKYASEHRLGLVVPPGDASAATAAINRLAGSVALREDLGSNGRIAFAGHSEESFREQVADGVFAGARAERR